MQRLRAGTLAPRGYYLSLRKWQIVAIDEADGILVGDADETFLQLPSLMVAAGGPVLSGLFFLSFPIVALGVVAGAAVRTTGDVFRGL